MTKDLLEKKELSLIDKNRIIEMAWEDRTPFEAIEFQFALSEMQVVVLMRKNLKRSSFNLWRKRTHSGASQKHLTKMNGSIPRSQCTLQKIISMNEKN